MIDQAFRQFIQDAIASNLEPTINIVLGGNLWSGRVTNSKTWWKSLQEQGIPSAARPCDLDLDAFHLKNCIRPGGIHCSGVLRFRMDAVQAWWIEPVREKAKITVL